MTSLLRVDLPEILNLTAVRRGLGLVRILADQCRTRHAIDAVNVMLDAKNLLAVKFHFDERFVLDRKPKITNFLVLAHKIGSRDPKGQLLRRMAGNLDNGEFTAINPYFSFEEILIVALGNRLHHEAMMLTQVFFIEHTEGVVRRRDRTVVVLFSCGSRHLAFHQALEDEIADHTRSFFRAR